MAHIDFKADANASSRPSSGLSPEVIGRRIGIIIYWILLVFVLSAGAYSIIPQAFGF
jgi:hypothetical protein